MSINQKTIFSFLFKYIFKKRIYNLGAYEDEMYKLILLLTILSSNYIVIIKTVNYIYIQYHKKEPGLN